MAGIIYTINRIYTNKIPPFITIDNIEFVDKEDDKKEIFIRKNIVYGIRNYHMKLVSADKRNFKIMSCKGIVQYGKYFT